MPVALVDDQPVLIEINVTRDRNILFNVSKAAWQDDVKEALFVQVGLFKELQDLAANSEKRDETIQKAKRGLKRSQNDHRNLLERKEELVAEAKKKKMLLDTKTEDKYLEDLEKGESVLERFIDEQQKIAAEENDPKRKKWRSEVGRRNCWSRIWRSAKPSKSTCGSRARGSRIPC